MIRPTRLDAGHHLSSSAKPGPPPDKPVKPAPPPPPRWRPWLIVIGAVLTLLVLFRGSMSTTKSNELAYSALRSKVSSGQVKSITIAPNGAVRGELQDGTRYTSQIPTAINDDDFARLLSQKGVTVEASSSNALSIGNIVASLLPFLIFIGIFWWLGRSARRSMAGFGGIGRSKAKLYEREEKPSTTFADVAGYEGAKQEVREVVDFLKDPGKYRAAGARGPRGVLLVGPPGTGKTLLARAVAGEAGVPFLSVTGSSFVEMFVGVGASRVRDLFEDARKRAPAIIFIDEVDAIGGKRGGRLSIGGNDEREQTLNQLLAEMDGFDTAMGVVVMAATNRPESLDPALLRPGRFDRQVTIPLPNQAERRAILAVHAWGKQLATSGPDAVDLDVVSRATPGFSGADLANLVNEAAIFAVRADRQVLTASDFGDARDRVLIGRRDSSNALLPDEKRAVAVHESGHALVAALSENGDPVAKVTILPAGQALGVTEQLPIDERHLYSEGYLFDRLAISMGGRVAERIVLGQTSTGAANDLAAATRIATKMVREFGMSGRLGPVGFSDEGPNFLGDEGLMQRPYAEETQLLIDEEVRRLVREAEARAESLLSEHRDALDRLTGKLLEDETIDGSEVYVILTGGDRQPTPALHGVATGAYPDPGRPPQAVAPESPTRLMSTDETQGDLGGR
ncbi:MAG: ATP-dependent zinc metalloprotease FtsH [Frankiaceae bacterium]